MVFWVFAGRVLVDVSGNEFSVGRGGMWQVPRGKTKPRIFFSLCNIAFCASWDLVFDYAFKSLISLLWLRRADYLYGIHILFSFFLLRFLGQG